MRRGNRYRGIAMAVHVIALALLLVGATPALALADQVGRQTTEVASLSRSSQSDTPPHPCRADFDKFCAGKVVCGKGACHDCLNQHMAQLTRACAAAMERWDQGQSGQ
jgi:hypothetical protein